MSTLIVTYDDDAGELLSAALERAQLKVLWVEDLDAAIRSYESFDPLVVVIDTGFTGFTDLVERIRADRPWARVFLLEDPDAPVYRTGLPVLRKPFDVAELAPLLAREVEAAQLERERRRLERRTDQLVERERDLTRELEHAERLAAIGRIAASMAHEINNPLAVVQSSSIYVREVAEQLDQPELRECAADIELAVDRISTFVQHICGYARRERPHLTEGSTEQAVDVALRLVAPRARSRQVVIEIVALCATQVPHDPPRLAQALLNLLSNAVDAASTGGRHVWLQLSSDEDCVAITVDDDGPGISAEMQERLFEPFATTKPHGQGTGLGLPITKQIIEDHGGSITLGDHPTHTGTRAAITLPFLDTSRFPLLVLEEDTLVQRALVNALRTEGFPVEAAADFWGTEATTPRTAPSIVIADVPAQVDEPNALVVGLRQHYPSARLLILVESLAIRVTGAEEVLTRPWNRQKLLSAVRRLCLTARSQQASIRPTA
ncbi:MAG TPA: ATP-binding protein [Polyangiaceae bacterium]|nr:ATP-binding protein [Polyangiaceae bacterium]